jgi:uncharacterized protein YdiU (UPF0061 family)
MNSDHTPADQAASPAPPSGIGQLLERVDCSLIARLTVDPTATADGRDHRPREVRSGHFVPVAPTPIGAPQYVAHSPTVFAEMGLDEALVQDPAFRRLFSGDLSQAPAPLRTTGWATGYALSIYGTEYTQQCPFGTGNGYGDGRAISVMELVHEGRRWELQLKGSGPTPYCRGGDGRAVLRSSVREFLAQEFMHALGVRTSRSFTLYASTTDTVMRPWYSAGSRSMEPDVMQRHRVAIATRTASSFLRVGQLELFARRARSNAHPEALKELRAIVAHAIEREYAADIDTGRPFGEQVVALARRFRARLTALVADWIRVGYCQGNFNSDNCAVGGFTLDYGPFGFCEPFDPFFQPWTGGGRHYSFFNQPTAAEANFRTLCSALRPLVHDDPARREELDAVEQGFAAEMDLQLRMMWARKLGLERFDADLFASLMSLMQKSRVDYTLFFRALCDLPRDAATLESTFHVPPTDDIRTQWQAWLDAWHARLEGRTDYDPDAVSSAMKRISPRYAWREWLVAQAYENAEQGDYAGVRALQTLLTNPYAEQSSPLAAQSDQKRPAAFERLGGVSHYTCSS